MPHNGDLLSPDDIASFIRADMALKKMPGMSPDDVGRMTILPVFLSPRVIKGWEKRSEISRLDVVRLMKPLASRRKRTRANVGSWYSTSGLERRPTCTTVRAEKPSKAPMAWLKATLHSTLPPPSYFAEVSMKRSQNPKPAEHLPSIFVPRYITLVIFSRPPCSR